MKKALSGQFLWGAFALSLAALLTAGQNTPKRTAVELNRLQGYWEGEGAGGKCSITITGDSLTYRAGTNWWKTTFKLPAGTDPQQHTPPSTIVRHQRMASAKWSSPSSRWRMGHSPWLRSTGRTSRQKLLLAPRAATLLRRSRGKMNRKRHDGAAFPAHAA